MNILAMVLASAVATAPVVKVPMTEELAESFRTFIMTNIAVCKKRNINMETCKSATEVKLNEIREKTSATCADYPKEVVPCIQYWLSTLMDNDSKKNMLTLSYTDA